MKFKNDDKIQKYKIAVPRVMKYKKGRLCTYNVTAWPVRAINFAVGKQYFICISSVYWFVALSYPACNAYALYYHLWFIWLQNIFFSQYLINDAIFGEKKFIEQ